MRCYDLTGVPDKVEIEDVAAPHPQGIYELERIGEGATVIFLTADQAKMLFDLYRDLGFENMVRLAQ